MAAIAGMLFLQREQDRHLRARMLFASLLDVEDLLHLVDPCGGAEEHLPDDFAHEVMRNADALVDECAVGALLVRAIAAERSGTRCGS